MSDKPKASHTPLTQERATELLENALLAPMVASISKATTGIISKWTFVEEIDECGKRYRYTIIKEPVESEEA